MKLNLAIFALLLSGVLLLSACKKEALKTEPVVSISTISNVTDNSASCLGNVSADGGVLVTSRGICCSATNPTPTTSDGNAGSGSGIGSFSGALTGLTAGTTYNVRAYATNSVGTAYSSAATFKTLALSPVLTTVAVSAITSTTATSGGNITNDGGSPVTARGVCWGTVQNPTIAEGKSSDGTGTGNFTSSITGLAPGVTYYIRAYATNSIGTAYGNQLTAATLAILPTITTTAVTAITSTTATSGGNVAIDGGVVVTVRGVCWSTSQTPTTSNSKTTDGAGTGSFASAITGLAPGTIYYIRAYATNNIGTAYGTQVTATATAILPALTTTAASAVTSTTASSGGNISNDGGATVTARGVCWSTSQNPTTVDSKTTDSSGPGIFTSSITGLTPGGTFYVRAYATNSAGTAYGLQVTATAAAILPTLTTTAVSAVTSNTATSGGNITNDGGGAVTVGGVCWSTAQNPTTADNKTSDGTAGGTFTSAITGLLPGTTYYIRAYATNSIGTAYGTQVTATATAILPTLTTTAMSAVTATSAASGGNITNDGGATITAHGVCWSTSQTPTIANNKTSDGTGSGTFSSAITGLTAGTTYYIRAYATNSIGTAYGTQVTATATAVIPILTTTAVSAVTATSATSGGNITNDGGATVTARGVCWSTSQTPTVANNKSTDGTAGGTFTSSITGLAPGTTYYIRAYATNSIGTAYGTQVTVTTTAVIPTLTTTAVSSITATSATSGGNISNDGGATVTARGVCWSTSQNPTTVDNKTSDGTAGGTFTSAIIGLSSSTTYYVRAYATNSAGTSYGNQVTGTTIAPITVPGAPTIGTATSGGSGSASVAFTAPSSNGGATITSYTATSSPAGGTGTVNQAGSGTITVTGLTNGTAYTFTVTASNSAGTSPASAASNSVTPVSLSIGGSYQGGTIAYFFAPGDPGYVAGETHGLITATSDQGPNITWNFGGLSFNTTLGTVLGTGSANTTTIIANFGNSGSYAAKICKDYTGGGYNDWYLPSSDEMYKIYLNKAAISGLVTALYTNYWTSSLVSAYLVIGINLGTGSRSQMPTNFPSYVRAIRMF